MTTNIAARLADGFWAHVQVSDGCWTWTGARDWKGYGRVYMGRINGRKAVGQAHRRAWELSRGDVPPGMFVLHRCDNPPCVRPDHLFIGTAADNMRDMVAKGRHNTPAARAGRATTSAKLRGVSKGVGESNANARLTRKQVDEIRRRFSAGGEKFLRVAAEYGVSDIAIANIVKGRSWAK